tara:strand:+ start:897 stop:1127 length:231 start_codon:yes stop_codon:yes gene_type:complete
MIRKKQPPWKREVIIDLTGPDGNAFALMGYARRFARQLGYSKEDQDQLLELMTSGDYENLIEVFDDHFGSFVILER